MSTGNNRKVHVINFEPKDVEFGESVDEIENSKAIKWHRRLGHTSRKYLMEFSKQYPSVLTEEDLK